ncbi:formylglycine-generating enzyme family protein [Jannaschia rubra]|uniref:Formylglycine-generating sulfatase enzyme n=1 Tax=Jannaschia rubra TaxID=282197 RepID=A0A0M6XPZ3_9RHOB|nr:SUMF1/EgtB/PvdO family nonheme iron enzyme [Jannaschia rubra]CTQ32742.1 Formylglycine-generating sulfatase enzyme [Jannaschia rubra]SFF88650.1 Sulfatase-modifying factor enzyme 1 [Jannaschia rubra]
MKTPAAKSFRLQAALAATVLAAAGTIGGAVLLTRGPAGDLSLLPDTVPVAVTLAESDGPRPLWVQRDEVTVAQWNACFDAGGCGFGLPVRSGSDAATTPATGLSYPDTQQYTAWISDRTGHPFRLPDLAEWEVLAASVLHDDPDPIFTDPNMSWASSYLLDGRQDRVLRPSGAFSTSADGVRDLDGSVWEWTTDCYAGSAGEVDPDRCPAFWVGGEHLSAIPFLERDPARGGCAVGAPPAHLGMRLVTDREPPTPRS